jgi:threonine/homoserine/homoserine lactone efflux protein
MELEILLAGLLIGFSIAAPVGPVGVLTIRRTLNEGRLSGLATGLGAATADAVYGSVAGFGITFIANLLVGQRGVLGLLGGFYLCYLGISTFLAPPRAAAPELRAEGLWGNYLSTFFLTLTNPMTILSFTAIFAGLGPVGWGGRYQSAALLISGVFLGSVLWWLILTEGVSTFRSRFSQTGLRWVNWVSGTIITGFGVLALFSQLYP